MGLARVAGEGAEGGDAAAGVAAAGGAGSEPDRSWCWCAVGICECYLELWSKAGACHLHVTALTRQAGWAVSLISPENGLCGHLSDIWSCRAHVTFM